jgi:hypothetical protein
MRVRNCPYGLASHQPGGDERIEATRRRPRDCDVLRDPTVMVRVV